MSKINVLNINIDIQSRNKEDFISLTDMLQAKDGDFFISDWLRNRNTVEFIGIWEKIHNPKFNYGEFATIKNKVGMEHKTTISKNQLQNPYQRNSRKSYTKRTH